MCVSPSRRRIWARSPVARGLPYAIASARAAEARSCRPARASSRAASTEASRDRVVALANSRPSRADRSASSWWNSWCMASMKARNDGYRSGGLARHEAQV
ncbi:hypothetical protein ACWDCC_07855 [Streptomyces sp. NPDC001102]